MYGLVNQGIRKMVSETFGVEKWDEIFEKSGVEEVFIAMEPYPDAITLDIVGAACEVLGLESSQVLQAFGKWWISFAAKEYVDLFKVAGDTFEEFISNLNDIHTRVGYMLTRLTPPSFKITERTDSSFILHYYSKREGLYPMVLGMIEGIGEWFKTEIEVTHVEGAEEGLDHDKFHIKQMTK